MFARVGDLTALLGRIVIGIVFLAHGLQKWDKGIDGTAAMMAGSGLPLPEVAAVFTIAVEIIGSVAFIVGFALPLVGIGYAVVGLGAVFAVHLDAGLTGQGGYEFVLVLAAAGLALGFNGGAFSLDRVLFGGRFSGHRQDRTKQPA
ncbi:DoxX family protein [Amycolatopsis antarctica]|uniref:DoxX family protein n=1 Tax=Amycolatopsis antarctica TaxID=1854586 RepID=A0A263D9F3_9PSEU|nr:DoxX family protein [Amycolatopsis antarctica]OZM75093.1 DoxX family protein [Amycolatopsis antarctica]